MENYTTPNDKCIMAVKKMLDSHNYDYKETGSSLSLRTKDVYNRFNLTDCCKSSLIVEVGKGKEGYKAVITLIYNATCHRSTLLAIGQSYVSTKGFLIGTDDEMTIEKIVERIEKTLIRHEKNGGLFGESGKINTK